MTKVVCANCDWNGEDRDLLDIQDFADRVDPGEIMPHGECPKCRAFCHAYEEPHYLTGVERESYAVLNFKHITGTDELLLAQMENSTNVPEGILYVQFVPDNSAMRVKTTDEDIDALTELRAAGLSAACIEILRASIQDPAIRGVLFDDDGPEYDRMTKFERPSRR